MSEKKKKPEKWKRRKGWLPIFHLFSQCFQNCLPKSRHNTQLFGEERKSTAMKHVLSFRLRFRDDMSTTVNKLQDGLTLNRHQSRLHCHK